MRSPADGSATRRARRTLRFELLQPRCLLAAAVLEMPDVRVHESEPHATVLLTLSHPVSHPVTVDVQTARGSAGFDDFTAGLLTVHLEAGQTERTVDIPLHNDELREADERFSVLWSQAVGAELSRVQSLVTIVDDDAVGRLNHDDRFHLSGGGPLHAGSRRFAFSLGEGLELQYNSLASQFPIIDVASVLPQDSPVPDAMAATLTWSGVRSDPVDFEVGDLAAGDPVRWVLPHSVVPAAPGTYSWELVVEHHQGSYSATRSFAGIHTSAGGGTSPFGAYWSLSGLDSVVADEQYATLVRSDGTAIPFPRRDPDESPPEPGEGAPPEPLTENHDGTWTYQNRLGSRSEFDHHGRLRERVDRNGNRWTYRYDEQGVLRELEDPRGRIAGFETANGRVIAVRDLVGRVVSLEHDLLGHLVAVQWADPDGAGPAVPPRQTFSYDSEGRMRTAVSSEGGASSFEYDAWGRLIRQVLPGGGVETYVPAWGAGADPDIPAGQRRPLADPFAWAQHTDSLGYSTRYRLDHLGQPVETQRPDGTAITIERRSGDGRPIRIEWPDPDGLGPLQPPVTLWEWDARGNLTRWQGPASETDTSRERIWEYHSEWNVPVRFVDELGHVTLFDVDPSNGQIRSVTRIVGKPDGASGEDNDITTSWTYTAAPQMPTDLPGGLPLRQVEADGTVHLWEYGEVASQPDFGLPLAYIEAAGSEVERERRLEYGADGRLARSTDALGATTHWSYDAVGRLVQVTHPDPDGPEPLPAPNEHFAYDGDHRLIRHVETNGNVTEFVYDEAGRLTLTRYPDPDGDGPRPQPERHYAYNLRGELDTATAGDGVRYTFQYDVLGRLNSVQQWSDAGPVPTMTAERFIGYNRLGDVVVRTDEMGRITRYERDHAGNVAAVYPPDPAGFGVRHEAAFRYTYDRADRLVTQFDADDRSTLYSYDALGHIASRTFPDPDEDGPLPPPVTVWEWSPTGDLLSMTDALGNTTQWKYDALGRRVREIDSTGDAREWHYDAVGNVVSLMDRLGHERRFVHDALQRPIEESWMIDGREGPSFHWTYGSDGYLREVVERNELREIAYRQTYDRDMQGRLQQVLTEWEELASLQTVQWDDGERAIGSRWWLPGDDGWEPVIERQLQLDDLGRPAGILQFSGEPESPSSSWRADVTFRPDGTFASIERFADLQGATPVAGSDYAYDSAGRLTGLTHHDGDTTLLSYAWSYDSLGRLASEIEAGADDGEPRSRTFGYDAIGQIVSVERSQETPEHFTYDVHGNRISDGFTVDPHGRILSDGTYEYAYDAEGNRTMRTRVDAQGAVAEQTEYSWDPRGRLTEVVDRGPNQEVLHRTQYAYDPWNRRLAVVIDADGEGPEGPERQRLLNDGDQLLFTTNDAGEVLSRVFSGPAVDQVFGEQIDLLEGGGLESWWLGDHQGTIRAAVDASGEMTSVYRFDAFGQRRSAEPGPAEASFAFTGRVLDGSTGLQYHRARYYDPATGTWLSLDPAGFHGGDTNRYRFVGNDPINRVDPSGYVGRPHQVSRSVDMIRSPREELPLPERTGLVRGIVRRVTSIPNPLAPLVPDGLHWTWGSGVELEAQAIAHAGISFDVDLGFNPGAPTLGRVYTAGASLSTERGWGPGVGGGIGVHGRVTNAPYVGLLDGPGHKVGGRGGMFTGEVITNRFNGGQPPPGAPPLPHFWGVQVGAEAPPWGVGLYADETETRTWHTGPSAPPRVFPNPQPRLRRAGDDRQFLNPGP